jgi:hypothetical protein
MDLSILNPEGPFFKKRFKQIIYQHHVPFQLFRFTLL